MKTYQSHGKIQLFAKMPTFKFKNHLQRFSKFQFPFSVSFFIISHPVHSMYIRTVNSKLLFLALLDSLLSGLGSNRVYCLVQVVLPKQPKNQFKPVQKKADNRGWLSQYIHFAPCIFPFIVPFKRRRVFLPGSDSQWVEIIYDQSQNLRGSIKFRCFKFLGR